MKKIIFVLLKIAEISLIPIAWFLFNYIFYFGNSLVLHFMFKEVLFSQTIEFTFANFWLGLSFTTLLGLVISFFIFAAPALFMKWIYANQDWSEKLSKWLKSRFS